MYWFAELKGPGALASSTARFRGTNRIIGTLVLFVTLSSAVFSVGLTLRLHVVAPWLASC